MRLLIAAFFIFITTSAVSANDAISTALDLANERSWSMALEAAKRSSKSELETLIQWRKLLDRESGASFDEIIRFMQHHPDWPYQEGLRERAETALGDGWFDKDLLLQEYRTADPSTGIGKIILAETMIGSGQKNVRSDDLIRNGWVEGGFGRNIESRIVQSHAALLNTKDHEARIDRLLWDQQTSAAERMLNYVSAPRRNLYKARIALIRHSRKASAALSRVPAAQRTDAGLIFDRIRYKSKRGDDAGVRELLRSAPKDAPYPDKWWRYRHIQVRDAIYKRHYKTAANLIGDYEQLDRGNAAEAMWLKGWLALEYNNRPQKALQAFEQMHRSVGYPVSLARAAYWSGRAAEKLGKTQQANAWYRKAGEHSTTFYGQLALLKLGVNTLSIPNHFASSSAPQTLLERAIALCLEYDEEDIAAQLITHAIAHTDDAGLIARIADMGKKAGLAHVSVRASKKALQQHVVLPDIAYPQTPVPSGLTIEKPLTYAIIRQESEFNRTARSRANAIGMMQLLPSTARDVARKLDMPYRRDRLIETSYNITLGSHYLARRIASYDGNYILAIASYNAGPGNVNKWVKQLGRPYRTPEQVINWMEHIPFSETRNYVQRVLENLQAFRYIENPANYRLEKLHEDLLR